jgi:hypothetical protein
MTVFWDHARCNMLEAHARRVYASAVEPDIDAALALAGRIKAGTIPSPFTYRDVYRNGWSSLDTPDATRRAVAVLTDHGWLREVVTPTAGRDREDLYIHPSLPRKSLQNFEAARGTPLTKPTEAPSVSSVSAPSPAPRESRQVTAPALPAREVIEL